MKLLKLIVLTLVLLSGVSRGELKPFDNRYIEFYIQETLAEKALIKFSNQANLSFFLAYDLVEGVSTKPLVGKFTIPQAINILFSGTSLSGRLDSNGNLKVILRQIVEDNQIADEQSHMSQTNVSDNVIETIVITGLASSLPSHIRLKKISPNMVEVIDRDSIYNQAEQNITENLQNSVGVNIARSLGEGTDISVRGFGPKYNLTTINGRTIATSREDRNFDYRLLPSDFVSSVIVNKSPSSSTTAGSIGANIDVETAKPFQNSGFHSLASSAVNFNEYSGLHDYHYSGLVSNTFRDNSVGLMFGLLNDKSRSQIDRYTTQRLAQSNILPENLLAPILDVNGNVVDTNLIRRPLRMIYDVQDSQQRRTSFSAVVQYKDSDVAVHTFDFLYANYERYSSSSGVQFPGQSPNYSNVVVDKNNSLQSATIFDNNLDAVFEEQIEDIDTYALGYNSRITLNKWAFELDLTHSRARAYEALNSLIPHYTYDDAPKFIDLDFTLGDVLSSVTNIPTNDPSRIKAHWNGKLDSELVDRVNELRIDAQYYLDEGLFDSLKVGVQLSRREKNNREFKWNDNYQCAPCGGHIDLPDELFSVVEYPNFLGSEEGKKPKAWLKLNNIKAYNQTMQRIMEMNGIVPEGTSWHDTVFDPSASYINKEENSAAYFKFILDGNDRYFDWYGDFGVRYLKVKNQSSGYVQEIDFIELDTNSSENELRLELSYSEPIPQIHLSEYDYFLPSANLNVPINDFWLIKIAAAKVISFPPIEAIGINQQFTSDDTGTVLLTGGNPNLMPYSANQYEFSLQYYPKQGSSYSLALFHKDIDTHITTATFEREFQGSVSPEVLKRRPQIVEIVNRNENVPGGSLVGIEMAANISLLNICQLCEGISINGTYTHILSNQIAADPVTLASIKEPRSSIEGLSKHSYSFNILYNMSPFKAYVGWNWRSSFLHARQGIRTRGIPEHTEERGQLDARLSYSFEPTLEAFIEVFNITDAANLEYADIRSRVTHVEYSGIFYKVGIRKNW